MRSVSIALMSILCAAMVTPASADNDKGKGSGNGGPKVEKNDKNDRNDNDQRRGHNDTRGNRGPVNDQRAGSPIGGAPYQQVVIVDRDRNIVGTYYRREHAAGRCPPGLAKKNCLPPGQTNRAWVIGQPLPPQIAYESMPPELWRQLTPPPSGYEYVRVNDDIVLMSTTTRVIAGLLGNIGNFTD